ncbi:MAG TPA: hypothetical protein EYQ36_07995, partial [Sulfitobacter sp.]|nr:hypothetical protein [Sulfitobacter sp.]
DESGWSVSLSSDGSVVAIGARYNNDNGDQAGHVQHDQWIDSLGDQRRDDRVLGEGAGGGDNQCSTGHTGHQTVQTVHEVLPYWRIFLRG